MALITTNSAALAALADKATGEQLTAAEYTTLKDALQEVNTTFGVTGLMADLVVDVSVASGTSPRPTLATVPTGRVWIPERCYALPIPGVTMADSFTVAYYAIEPGGGSDRLIGTISSAILADPTNKRVDVSTGASFRIAATGLLRYQVSSIGPSMVAGTTARLVVTGLIL